MKYKVTLNKRTYEVEVEQGEAMLVDEYEAYAPAPAAPVAAPVAAAPVAAAPAPVPAAASLAAAWSFLLKSSMTTRSNTNSIRRPAETKPINSQFSVFTLRSFIGMKLRSVHPSAASTGV